MSEVFLVGGAVRDKLLGLSVKEKDWVVVGSTEKDLLNQGYLQVGKDFPVFLHPETKEEYALARKERKISAGHKGFEIKSGKEITLKEDLERRDLTINAIAQSEEGEFIDPFGGMEDIKNKKIRKVSDSFVEDPLRVFRVARFAAKLNHLGFSIDKETLETMKEISKSGELETLPKERLWKETEKAIHEKSPHIYFMTLLEAGALDEKEFKPEDFASLEKINNDILPTKSRWASLLIIDDLDMVKLENKLGVPKKVNEFSSVCKDIFDFYRGEFSEKSLMNLILKTDGLRRDDRFRQALSLVNELKKSEKESKDLKLVNEELLDLLISVSPTSKDQSGEEIAKEIQRKRLVIINKYLLDHE